MMKIFMTIVTMYFGFQAFAQQPVGIFKEHGDIGRPTIQGSTVYDVSTQVYTQKAGGYNIWFGRDEFQYAFNKIKGDFILTANFEFEDTAGNMHRKFGWMVRESSDEDASHMTATIHGNGLIAMQWRVLKGAMMRDPQDEIFFPKKKTQTIQLERSGKQFLMRVANWGEPLQLVGSHQMPDMPDSVLAGIFLCSHDTAKTETAKIWNVRIDRPVPTGYNPSREGWIGCRLETMTIADGKRKVIHESKSRFEAPNWMPDGKKILYNENGSLFKIPIEGGTPEKLNTDTLARMNNDHGISFDGKMLAVSHHRPGLPGYGSTVYILPIEGGVPKLLTEKTPSYWHGWNPNGKEVLYVAQREGAAFDIFKMPVNGGKEINLTSLKSGHVDGPEFSPDGKYIYYNGNISGTMQIWRMKPDGTEKEQLTFDEYNNWFPHISPDGKWMVIISFPTDIEPNEHPSYKRVMLRLISLSGFATPKVIAHLYGGQGTINVPSWSPDSKSIAFVSNSEKFEK